MRNRKTLLYAAAGISALTIGWAIFRPKAASAAKSKKVPFSQRTVALIGDSQTAGQLGKAFEKVFCDYGAVNYFGKPGATHEDYLRDPALRRAIAKMPAAKSVYIQLGDNGVSANTGKVTQFVRMIQKKHPGAKIYWGGPMKAVAPTTSSNYVTLTDSESPRYLPTYNTARRTWKDRIKRGLRGTGVKFVDNYRIQETRPSDAAFSDSRGGDGIHLTADSAYELAAIARDIVDRGYQS